MANPNMIDLIDKNFGYGTVTKHLGCIDRGKGKRKISVHKWELKCQCGSVYESTSESLLNGKKKSCGCYKFRFQNMPTNTSYYTSSVFSVTFSKLKEGAKKRNHVFEITKQDLLDLLEKQGNKCALSSVPISFMSANASVDRRDNNKGYTLDNIQILHRTVNFMKNTLTNEELIYFCKQISLTSLQRD